MSDSIKQTIVVGVDGSKPSVLALQWAVRQAELTGAAVRAITAWNFPNDPTPFGIVPDIPPPQDQVDKVRARLEEVVAGSVPASSDVEVRAEVITGHAASILVEAASDAELLVVGNRGRGAVAEALLGSVSEHCVRHSACPVVVLRQPKQHP